MIAARCKMSPWLLGFVWMAAIGNPLCAEQDWTQWRGPSANGVANPGSYPLEWSAEKNVMWRYELPGPGSSTPILFAGKLFVTSAREDKNCLTCLDMQGSKLWAVDLGQEVRGKHAKATGCNSSPITDGQRVYAYFKSGELAAVDFEGNIVWQKNLYELYGEDTLWWDQGTSPVLTEKAVVVARMHDQGSCVLAFDKASGEELWKADRDLPAPKEAKQSYTTPLVVGAGEEQKVIVLGADHVTAHRAATGEMLWKCGGLNPESNGFFRSISSPVISGDLVIAPYARGATLTAIRMGGSGDVTESHVAWESGPAADVPSPVAHEGRIYILTDSGRTRGRIIAYDAETGDSLMELELPRSRATYSSSMILANGHLFATNENGLTHVIKIEKDQLQLVGSNELDEMMVATPVFADSRIYLRTKQNLYCIGSTDSK